MSVQSSSPPRAGLVYTLLIVAGIAAAIIGAATVGWISYRYASDIDVREGDRLYQAENEGHGSLPAWIVSA